MIWRSIPAANNTRNHVIKTIIDFLYKFDAVYVVAFNAADALMISFFQQMMLE